MSGQVSYTAVVALSELTRVKHVVRMSGQVSYTAVVALNSLESSM